MGARRHFKGRWTEFDFFVYFQLLSHINFLVLFLLSLSCYFIPTAVQRGEVVMAKPPPLREDDVDFYI